MCAFRTCLVGIVALLLPLLTGCPEMDVPGDGQTAVKTGILLVGPAGSEVENFDLYAADGTTRLSQAHSLDELIETGPGTYVVTQYFNPDFVYARNVVVIAGQTTTVTLGAIHMTTVAGSEAALFDIYDAGGTMLLARPNDSDKILPVPAGTYVLKQYFNDAFVYADGVAVVAGQTTTVPMGAFQLLTAPGTPVTPFDTYDASGTQLLERPSDTDVLLPVPPGTYVMKDYFNDAFVFAQDVVVVAGETTTRQLGGILYSGPESIYDLYDASGNTLLERPADAGEIQPAPAGTYVLKKYFDDEILAAGVVVQAGAVTAAP